MCDTEFVSLDEKRRENKNEKHSQAGVSNQR